MKPTRDGEGVASDKTSENLPYPNPNIERDKVEEIRERLAKATLVEHRYDHTPNTCSACGCTRSLIEHMAWTCRVDPAAERDFIAHAREDIPYLLERLTVSEKRAEESNEASTVLANALRAAIDERDGFIATIERLESAAKQSRSSLMRVGEAAIKQLAVLEQHTHPLELGTGAVIREIRSALQASGDG